MSKNISFSSDELEEIRAFYQQDLSKADQRVKNLKAIVSKLGAEPKKRGRKSTKPATGDLDISDVMSEIKSKKTAKTGKRGRKAGVPNKPKTAVASKVKAAVAGSAKVGKSKAAGVKPAKVSGATKVSKQTKVAARVKKAGVAKPAKAAKVAKAPKVAKAVKSTGTVKAKSTKKAAAIPTKKSATKTAAEKVSKTRKPKAGLKTPSPAKDSAANSSAASDVTTVEKKTKVASGNKPKAVVKKDKATRAVKPVKVVEKKKTAASKLEVVSKDTSGKPNQLPSEGSVVKIALSKKPAGKLKVVKVKSEIKKPVQADDDAIKRRKSQWTSFLLEFLGAEKRFIPTPDIIEAGQKKFKLSGKEKDTAKNTIQATLFRLGSENQIQSRKKDNSRIAYWAAIGVSDEGFSKPSIEQAAEVK